MTDSRRRLRSLARLAKVQSELHRLEEQKLGVLRHRGAELYREKVELIEALDGHDTFYGAFIYPMAKRLRVLDQAADDTRVQTEKAVRRVAEQGARKKRAERVHAVAEGMCERADEKNSLLDAIERAARGKTSLP
ncbi:hypothetical protein BH10PSE7_BH10PSE7_31020 [soil metagenome]